MVGRNGQKRQEVGKAMCMPQSRLERLVSKCLCMEGEAARSREHQPTNGAQVSAQGTLRPSGWPQVLVQSS